MTAPAGTAHAERTASIAPPSPLPRRLLAILRIATGLVFLWPFMDKTFGLGYATPPD